MQPDTFEAIREAIHQVLGVERADITPDKTFGDLGADSLDAVELVMQIECDLDIEIPDEQMPGLEHTLGDFVKVVDGIRTGR
jgi:acyl carrier protein